MLACSRGPAWTACWRVPLVTSSRWRLGRRLNKQQSAHRRLFPFAQRARLIGTACIGTAEQRSQVGGSRGTRGRDHLQRLCSRLSAAAAARSTTVTSHTLAALRSCHAALRKPTLTRQRTTSQREPNRVRFSGRLAQLWRRTRQKKGADHPNTRPMHVIVHIQCTAAAVSRREALFTRTVRPT